MRRIKNNLKYIVFIIILFVICFFIVGYYYFYNNEDEIILNEEKQIKEDIKNDEKVYYLVDIKGAVNNPGVYKLEENSRVIDVINLSGGLKENADTSNINLSKKIKDEMFIIIYTKEQIEKYKTDSFSTKEINKKLEKEIVVIDNNNDAQINFNSENVIDNNSDNNKININTATKEELINISGIGESKAQAIIKYRKENGNFKQIDEIKNVSGIGDSLFEKIKDDITI